VRRRRTPLVVGCPVHRRAWIMDRWFDSVEAQELPDGTRFVFALSEQGDPTERVIARRCPQAEVAHVPGPAFSDAERDHPARYGRLAEIRNRLLKLVASYEPHHFLSWDSDILLEPGAFWALAAVREPAVGALVDMGGDEHPGNWSWMLLDGRDAFRPFSGHAPIVRMDLWRVGVIMGAKLLSLDVVRSVRYADHILGEDVGWAINAEALGIPRYVCGKARGVHVYRSSLTTKTGEPVRST
jgi:hypothetical protein